MTQLVGQAMIDHLKEQGWEVKVVHLRLSGTNGKALRMKAKARGMSHDTMMSLLSRMVSPAHILKSSGASISPHGGITVVQAKKGDKVFEGRATCSPLDNFQRRAGLIRATGRLTSALGK